ncbi:uncharacterized protein LOC100208965 [Hydra vulgaris]|uniref:uncharacterized protein LOC100208965 n=1 Tax=Hydra vulgaris TaxID=6087 RepID=UPI00019268B2|nr:uncharacterized protein LOC100208965 [Hydra vulgaris]
MSNKIILAFGDSLTEGWINGGRQFYSFTSHLKQLLNNKGESYYEIVNAGLSGEVVSPEMFLRLPTILSKYKHIDLLILQGGTNDILNYKNIVSAMNLFDEFKKLIDTALNYNVKKICALTIMEGYYTASDNAVLSHTECNKVRLNFNRQLCDYVRSCGNSKTFCCDISSKLPLFSLQSAEQKMFWDDLLHPSICGYKNMALHIYNDIDGKF